MDKLKFIKEQMDSLKVPYEFGEWTSEVTYPYFVGEVTEDSINTEDGAEQSTMLLTGFNRGSFIELFTVKEMIKNHFHPIYGLRGNTENGVIAVFYDSSFSIPSGEAALRKIQINLTIKEWKGVL